MVKKRFYGDVSITIECFISPFSINHKSIFSLLFPFHKINVTSEKGQFHRDGRFCNYDFLFGLLINKTMNFFKIISCFICLMTSAQLLNAQQPKQLTSHDGKLIYSFALTKEGAP